MARCTALTLSVCMPATVTLHVLRYAMLCYAAGTQSPTASLVTSGAQRTSRTCEDPCSSMIELLFDQQLTAAQHPQPGRALDCTRMCVRCGSSASCTMYSRHVTQLCVCGLESIKTVKGNTPACFNRSQNPNKQNKHIN